MAMRDPGRTKVPTRAGSVSSTATASIPEGTSIALVPTGVVPNLEVSRNSPGCTSVSASSELFSASIVANAPAGTPMAAAWVSTSSPVRCASLSVVPAGMTLVAM